MKLPKFQRILKNSQKFQQNSLEQRQPNILSTIVLILNNSGDLNLLESDGTSRRKIVKLYRLCILIARFEHSHDLAVGHFDVFFYCNVIVGQTVYIFVVLVEWYVFLLRQPRFENNLVNDP